MTTRSVTELQDLAWELRETVLQMLHSARSGHPGGSLSSAEIMSVLYFHVLNIKPEDPKWPERDRFVMSKGHGCPTLYAALAKRGFFPAEELFKLRQNGSILPGHPDMNKTPGIDMSTGSLGQGISAAVGMALGLKYQGLSSRVYALLGCGELQEGQVWEAAMAAAHYKLDNLIAIIDYNRLQIDGTNAEVMEVEPLADKWRAFGWHVQEIDGHNVQAILDSIEQAQKVQGQPAVIIARTVKGKGVSFMENQAGWHGKAPSDEELKQALAELRHRRMQQ